MPHSVPAGPPLRPGERRSTSWAGFSGGRTRGPARPLFGCVGEVPRQWMFTEASTIALPTRAPDLSSAQTRQRYLPGGSVAAATWSRGTRRRRRVNDTGAAQELDAIVSGALSTATQTKSGIERVAGVFAARR